MTEPDWAAEGLLEGLDGKDREARIAILRDLHADGVPLDELRRAVEEERLMFLPVERALREEPRYSAAPGRRGERASTCDLLTAQWQALGLASTDPDERRLRRARPRGGEADQAVPRRRRARPRASIDMARVLGQSLARVAEASRFVMGQSFLGPDSTEYDVAQQARLARPMADLMEPTIAYVFGLQLVDQLRHEVVDRSDIADGPARDHRLLRRHRRLDRAVARRPRTTQIGSVADRLGAMATDLLRPPVRVVKMIGDAAMFVSPEPRPLLDLALDLVDAAEEDDEFPQLRAGLASGLAVGRWGDWYGRPVNLASRVCSRARPGSVLVTEPVADACEATATGSRRRARSS